MTKEERLKWIKERHEASLDLGEIPITKRDIQETIEEMPSFHEWNRDRLSQKDILTSDEK